MRSQRVDLKFIIGSAELQRFTVLKVLLKTLFDPSYDLHHLYVDISFEMISDTIICKSDSGTTAHNSLFHTLLGNAAYRKRKF